MTEVSGAIKPMREEEAIAHLAAIVDSSDDAILSRTADGIVTSWNRAAERLYGYRAEETVGRDISFLVPDGRMDELKLFTERILHGERVKNIETARLSKDGREIQVSLTLSPIFAADGSIIGISTIARDVSQRKQMERMLLESEERYRTLVEMAPDAVFVHTPEGRFVYANCAALGICGFAGLEQLQRSNLLDLVHPDDRGSLVARIGQLLAGEELSPGECRFIRPNGTEVSVESSAALIDYQGRPSIQMIARDVTERKRGEREREAMLKELAYQQTRFETVVRQLPVGVMIAEAPSGRVVYQNERSLAIFRKEQGEVASFADYRRWELYRPDGSPLPTGDYPLARAVLKGESIIGQELKVLRGDGTQGFVSVNATPIRDHAGEIVSGVATVSDITQSKAYAKALAESEERLNLALDAAGMGSCDMNAQTGAGIWSRRHFLLIGYQPPEGDSAAASIDMWQERIHPDDLEHVLRALDLARRKRTLFRSEHRIVRADSGRAVWVDVLGRFICDPPEATCRFIGVIFDATERKRTEEALRRSALRFRLMADTMPQIVWTADPDGSIDYLNAHFENYTGLSREPEGAKLNRAEEIVPDVVHPDDALETMKAWRHAVSSGEPYQHETRIKRRDGAYRWHLSRATAERDDQGRVVKWYGTATDINDLRETQEKLRASETRFRRLYESNLVAIFFWNKDGVITEANDAYCDLVGYSAEECDRGGLSWLETTAPDISDRDLAAMKEAMSRGICKSYEKVFINRKSGEKVSVLTAIARMADGQAEGIGFAVDLTELKRAEQALKESEATLKLAIETTGLGVFDLDLATGKGVWSDIARQHYGLPPGAETDLATVMAGVHPEDRERMEQIACDAARGGAGTYGAEYRTVGLDDGRERWLTMRARVSCNEKGEPVRLVGACLNITDIVQAQNALKEEMAQRLRTVEELRKQEQLLIRQARFAAMGEMIGNIAHQWRQPLNTLGLIVQELPTYQKRNLLSQEYLEGSVTRAMQVINYMSKTIDGFRNFFGPDKEKQTFAASDVLARTVSILDAAFEELKLKIDVTADPEVVIYGCPNEYSQVILNLLVNAKDAILERKVATPKIAVELFQEEGKTVLTITDNAGGIPADIIDKIFDPYFTTKSPDKGTGIGLFMSKTIIEKNMNGTLTVRNLDGGAQFRIEV